MSGSLKRGIKWALVRLGFASVLGRLIQPTTAILAYHNVVPRGEKACGAAGLHVDQSVFSMQLEFLMESYDIVSLEEAVSLQPGPRPRLAITFDDAYQGAMSAGLDELSRRGLPSTVFVPPGLLGTEGFWWDLIASGDPALDGDIREMCLSELKGQQSSVLAWARQTNVSVVPLPQHAWACIESELHTASHRGATIANHTWSHPNLAALDPQSAALEVERGRTWLATNVAGYFDCLAYPYGHVNEEALRSASSDAAGVTTEGGLAAARHLSAPPRRRIPRINVPRALTLEGLTLRLLGFGRTRGHRPTTWSQRAPLG